MNFKTITNYLLTIVFTLQFQTLALANVHKSKLTTKKTPSNHLVDSGISKRNDGVLSKNEYQKIYDEHFNKYKELREKLRTSSSLTFEQKNLLQLEIWDHFRQATEASTMANNL